LLFLKPAERPQFVATDRVRAWHPLLQPCSVPEAKSSWSSADRQVRADRRLGSKWRRDD
jgi:hypothetical protein